MLGRVADLSNGLLRPGSEKGEVATSQDIVRRRYRRKKMVLCNRKLCHHFADGQSICVRELLFTLRSVRIARLTAVSLSTWERMREA